MLLRLTVNYPSVPVTPFRHRLGGVEGDCKGMRSTEASRKPQAATVSSRKCVEKRDINMCDFAFQCSVGLLSNSFQVVNVS